MQISSLEGELVLSKSREDNLREEVAEFPRRETALRKLHSEALKEVGLWADVLVNQQIARSLICCGRLSPADAPSHKLGYFGRTLAPQEKGRTAEAEKKLANTISKMSQVWRPNKDTEKGGERKVVHTLESGDLHFRASRLRHWWFDSHGPISHYLQRRGLG